jgi:hypothetical protein
LKFALNGWVGPITGGQQPFDHTQSFSIDLPNREIFPSNTVIFVTGNHPTGLTVDIEYFDGEPLPGNSGTTSDISAPSDVAITTPASSTATTGDDSASQQINKLFKVPFQIEASAVIPRPLGAVSINFDHEFLQLTDAAIMIGEKIQWTFNSLQTGTTQIIVVTSGGPIVEGAESEVKVTYDVCIFLPTFIGDNIHPVYSAPTSATAPTPTPNKPILPDSSKAPSGADDGPLPVDNPNRQPHLPLSWLGFVNIGIELLKKAYPLGVQLLEVETTPLVPGSVTNPAQLNKLKIVASVRIAKNIASNTAILESTGWGDFGPIETSLAPWEGDVVIDWPVKMDLVESFKLLQGAGFKDPVDAVTLRQPLYPGIVEPFYIYTLHTGQFIGVGVNDGKVERFGTGNMGFLHGEPSSD